MTIGTSRLGWLLCAAAAVCFGAATPITKLIVTDVGPLTLAGLLYLGAAAAVLPFRTRAHQVKSDHTGRVLLLVAVVLGGGVAPVLMLLALHRTTATTVSLLLNLELVATVVVARLFLREHIGRRGSIGIAIVVLGGVVITGLGGAHLAPGALLVAGACLCWGIDNAITASLDRYSPATITLAKGAVAGSVNLFLGLSIEQPPQFHTVLAALAIGSIGYGLSITLWISGARLVGAARGQVIFALAPFIGAVLAWPLVHEPLRGRLLVAFAISLVGVMIVATSRHHHFHTHAELVHAHAIDAIDVHHQSDAIVMLGGNSHRHLARTHDHEHLPDIHHRHDH